MSGFDPDVLRPLLAGWIIGAALGLLETALVVIAVARSPGWPEQLSSFRVSIPVFTIAIVNAMLIGWTLVGLVMGALWIVVPMPRFAIGVCVIGLGITGLYAFIRGLERRGEATLFIGSGVLATVAFAGVLPLMATWQ